MTAPCSIALFFAIPDYPQNTKAWYLTERDIAIANARCARYNKKAIRGEFNLSVLKRTVFRWEYTSFVFLYIFYGQSVQPASYYSIWLKDKKQSVVISNIYPTFTSYVEMGEWLAAGLFRRREAFVAHHLICESNSLYPRLGFLVRQNNLHQRMAKRSLAMVLHPLDLGKLPAGSPRLQSRQYEAHESLLQLVSNVGGHERVVFMGE